MNLQIVAVQHVPEIRPGTNLSECLREAVHRSGWNLQPRDILAVTQKAVSKAEGRISRLGDVVPSAYSVSIARRVSKDPRLVEIILRESRRIVRMRGEVLICETHHGFICANAGVDESNVEGEYLVTLLPEDPDKSARTLAGNLGCGVIITDTFGRVWRDGLVDSEIGLGRVRAYIDLRGTADAYGHRLR